MFIFINKQYIANNMPSTKNTTKASTQTASMKTTPVVKKTTPVVKKTTPVVKKTTPVVKTNTKEEKSKKTSNKATNLSIPVSRVRTNAVHKGINVEEEYALKELKDLKKSLESDEGKKNEKVVSDKTKLVVEHAYATVFKQMQDRHTEKLNRLKKRNDPADAEKIKKLTEETLKRTDTLSENIELVSKLRYRFSGEASVALTAVLEYTVRQLVKNAIVNVCKDGKVIINSLHAVDGDFCNVDVYPLVYTLKCVKDLVGKTNTENEVKLPNKTLDFESSTGQICKDVKNQLANNDSNSVYLSVKVSRSLKVFCSSVVTELINRFLPLLKLYADSINIKTVTSRSVLFVFRSLLVDVTVTDRVVNTDDLLLFVDKRLEEYNNHKRR